jgi:hypothetical protein
VLSSLVRLVLNWSFGTLGIFPLLRFGVPGFPGVRALTVQNPQEHQWHGTLDFGVIDPESSAAP